MIWVGIKKNKEKEKEKKKGEKKGSERKKPYVEWYCCTLEKLKR